MKINLRAARLRGTRLADADLHDADLCSVDLHDAQLSGANLTRAKLEGADCSYADLSRAQLSGARLVAAKFDWADCNHAMFGWTNLTHGSLRGANLEGAEFSYADFIDANLSRANLKAASLRNARFVRTDLSNASLEGCSVFGVSAWGLTLDGANQNNLRIADGGEPAITVDDLEVAQFVYLMLTNTKVRRVIDTITTKLVLVLGRFTRERKVILDALRDELRQQDYLPILFDFDEPATRDLTETVSTLAHMSRFIIADITEPRSVPQELQAVVPHLPSVPVQPLILASQDEYGMFEHFKRYPWVLATYVYASSNDLIAALKEKVIAPAESKAKRSSLRKPQRASRVPSLSRRRGS